MSPCSGFPLLFNFPRMCFVFSSHFPDNLLGGRRSCDVPSCSPLFFHSPFGLANFEGLFSLSLHPFDFAIPFCFFSSSLMRVFFFFFFYLFDFFPFPFSFPSFRSTLVPLALFLFSQGFFLREPGAISPSFFLISHFFSPPPYGQIFRIDPQVQQRLFPPPPLAQIFSLFLVLLQAGLSLASFFKFLVSSPPGLPVPTPFYLFFFPSVRELALDYPFDPARLPVGLFQECSKSNINFAGSISRLKVLSPPCLLPFNSVGLFLWTPVHCFGAALPPIVSDFFSPPPSHNSPLCALFWL